MHSDSLDSEDQDDESEDGSMDLPENTRNFNPSWKLSKAWLQDVLADHFCKTAEEREGFGLTDFSVRAGSEPVSGGAQCERHPQHEAGLVIGDSALSEVLSVRAEYKLATSQDTPTPLDLVVKLPPRDPVSRFFVTEAQFDLREIKFYTQVSNIT